MRQKILKFFLFFSLVFACVLTLSFTKLNAADSTTSTFTYYSSPHTYEVGKYYDDFTFDFWHEDFELYFKSLNNIDDSVDLADSVIHIGLKGFAVYHTTDGYFLSDVSSNVIYPYNDCKIYLYYNSSKGFSFGVPNLNSSSSSYSNVGSYGYFTSNYKPRYSSTYGYGRVYIYINSIYIELADSTRIDLNSILLNYSVYSNSPIASLEQQIESLNGQIFDLNSQITLLNDELSSCRGDKQSLEDQVYQLTIQRDNLINEVNSLEVEVENSYNEGYQSGYDSGYNDKGTTDNIPNIIPDTVVGIWNSVFAPLMSFEIFGVPLSNYIYLLLSIALLLVMLKIIRG